MKQSPIEPDGLFDGLRWSPIIRWAIIDIVLSIFVSVPLALYFIGAEWLSDDEDAASQALDGLMASSEFLLWSLAFGLAVTAFASFRASRAAGTLYLRHGGWTAMVSAVFGFLLFYLPDIGSDTQNPLWFDSLSFGLILPAGVMGGWLASLKPASVQ